MFEASVRTSYHDVRTTSQGEAVSEQDDSGEARRLADEAMAQIAEVASRPPPPPAAEVRAGTRRRVALIGLAVGVPTLAFLLVQDFAVGGVRALLQPRLPEAELRLQILSTVNDLVIEIDAFYEDYGELPESLVEVASPSAAGWRYTLVGRDRYRVELTQDGQSVTYDSADDADEVFEEVRQP